MPCFFYNNNENKRKRTLDNSFMYDIIKVVKISRVKESNRVATLKKEYNLITKNVLW